MTDERLPDRWQTRDFPVLLASARLLDDGKPADADDQEFLDDLDLPRDDVARSLMALGKAGYVEVSANEMLSGDVYAMATALTERGRRAVGLWPDQDDQADALIELLTQAADHVDDEDDASALRKAGRLLRSVPSAVVADITTAYIRSQTGI